MADFNTLVTQKEEELSELNKRMDEAKDLIDMTSYVVKDENGNAISDAKSVTMNTAARYYYDVKTTLNGAKPAVVIDGELTDFKKTAVLNIIDSLFAQIDDELSMTGEAYLYDIQADRVTYRYGIGARLTLQDADTPICLPVDLRWCLFQYGRKGLDWTVNKTFRNGSDLNAFYHNVDGWTDVSGTDLEVRDCWNKDTNELWVAGKKMFDQENTFKYVPFVFAFPEVGPTLRDKGYLKNKGQDIFWLGKKLYDYENLIVSIEMTRAYELINPPYERQSKGANAPSIPPPKRGDSLDIPEEKGGLHQPLPVPDITNAHNEARADIKGAVDAVSSNQIDMGNASADMAATLYSSQLEVRSKVVNPRLKCLGRFYEQSARMLLNQALNYKGGEMEFGKIGLRRAFKTSDIGDPDRYTITYEFKVRSETQATLDRAQFLATKGELPLRTRLIDIGHFDDPDGIIRELEVEKAKTADPAIGLFEMALNYVEEAEDLDDKGDSEEADAKRIESMMCTERGTALIRQRGAVQQQLPPEANMPQVREQGSGGNIMQAVAANSQPKGGVTINQAKQGGNNG